MKRVIPMTFVYKFITLIRTLYILCLDHTVQGHKMLNPLYVHRLRLLNKISVILEPKSFQPVWIYYIYLKNSLTVRNIPCSISLISTGKRYQNLTKQLFLENIWYKCRCSVTRKSYKTIKTSFIFDPFKLLLLWPIITSQTYQWTILQNNICLAYLSQICPVIQFYYVCIWT